MKTIVSLWVMPLAIAAMGLAAPNRASAQGVGFPIFEDDNGGVETAHAEWSSDPSAVINVTKASDSPEVWLIDLSNSGHATLGGGDFPGFGNNGVMTWVEPEHPDLFNNLYFLDDTHWRLESENPVPANTNNDGIFGIFGNGTSIYAGNDFNGAPVFISVNERSVPEPATLAILGSGLAVSFLRRRKPV